MRQIRLKPYGPWHRPALLGTNERTACGEVIPGAFATREYELGEDLCTKGCWTRPERDTARDLAAAAAVAKEFEEGDTDVTEAPPLPPAPDAT